MSENIIQLKPKEKQDGLQPILPIKKEWCPHTYTTVDEDERTLQCDKCKKFIDPFDWVLSLARHERNYFSTIEEIKLKMKQLSEEYDRLYKDVNNLKATKRRIEVKQKDIQQAK